MNTDNGTILRSARESLKGKWGIAIITFFIFTVLTAGPGAVRSQGVYFNFGSLFALLIAGALALGAAIVSLTISRGKEPRVEQLFEGFRNFAPAFITYLLRFIYVLLWTLLLVIPGIIAALGYAMAFFILADNPDLQPQEVLRKSKAMMEGYKLKLFYLCLRFLLLAILCVLTLGIGFLWLIPYIHVTLAKFYDDINGNELFVQ